MSGPADQGKNGTIERKGDQPEKHGLKLRSQLWFDNPDNPGMTALYLERYLNFGLTREELQSGKPLIGIAQTGSDLSPCNRHHLELAKRVRAGIEAAFVTTSKPKGRTEKSPISLVTTYPRGALRV